MSVLGYVIIFSLIGGLFSLIGGVVLLSKERSAELTARYATPFAAGALLSAVFLDLLPEGMEIAAPRTVAMAALTGIVAFFFAERFLHWFHHHREHEGHGDPSRWLIITGDIIHNVLDGVAIAAAFLISIPTGIVTTIAVAAHEIPQEIGDFGLLLHKGMSRRGVLLVNVLSALATTAAAVLTFQLGSAEVLPIGVLLGMSAGLLLYIAMSDIIPEIHAHGSPKRLFEIPAMLLLLGVILVGLTIEVSHQYIDAGHNHSHESEIHHDDDTDHHDESNEHSDETGHIHEGEDDHKQ